MTRARIDQWAQALASACALFGGGVLCAAMAMTLASVLGRSFIWAGLGPVPGDFELVETAAACAAFAFAPWAHWRGAHVRVEILRGVLGRAGEAALDFAADLLMLGAACFLAERLWAGMWAKLANGDTSFILEFPIWIGYALACVGAFCWVLIAVWRVLRAAPWGKSA